MDATPQHILDQALRLSDGDRAALAATLINSLDAGVDLDADDKWDAEVKRRLEEIDNGSVELVPLSVVRQKLDQIRNGWVRVPVYPDADSEFVAAFQWYWDRNPVSADAFDDAVMAGVELIQRNPSAWPAYLHGTQKYVVQKFPFNIIYRHHESRVEIIAVAHQRRRPGYWSKRIV